MIDMELPDKLKGVPLLKKAYELAKTLHAGQERDNGEPYIVHPVHVCISLLGEFNVEDPEVLAAALLHDVLEDSEISSTELTAMFGPRVVAMVADVTKVKTGPDWKRKYYDNLRSANRWSQLIKFADRLDNLRDLPKSTREKRARYLIETKEIFLPWAKSFDDKIYGKLVEQVRLLEEMQ